MGDSTLEPERATQPIQPETPEAPTEPSGPEAKESLVARNKARAEAARAKLDEARGRVPALQAATEVQEHDRNVGGSLLAGAVAYRLFLWLLPVALVLAAGLGFLRAAGGEAPEQAAEDLGIGAYVTSTVGDAADQAERSRWVMLVIGLFALYFGAVAGAKVIRAVHLLAWRMPPTKMQKPWQAALVFLGFFVAVNAANVLAHRARDASDGLGIGVTLVVGALFGGLWLAASLLLPHADAPWTALIPGALLVGVGTQALQLVTAYYIAPKLASSTELYGALGAAAAVLLWLYLIGRIIVGAAMLNAVLWRRKQAEMRSAGGGL